jgi:hypothetical protein
MEVPVIKRAEPPVFVVGMNGSGTSMLTESLGRHSKLYAFPGETRMIPHYIDIREKFGDLEDDENFQRLWRYVVSSAPDFEIFNGGKIPELPSNWRYFPRDLPTILDAVFRQFAMSSGKQRWCEKSPNNSEHIVTLSRLFPGARFVHIIRDGRDCAASTNRRQYRNPELAIYRWRHVVAEARRQALQIPGRYIELRYEDLTEQPDDWMKKICEFLSLDFEPAVVVEALQCLTQGRSRNLQCFTQQAFAGEIAVGWIRAVEDAFDEQALGTVYGCLISLFGFGHLNSLV